MEEPSITLIAFCITFLLIELVLIAGYIMDNKGITIKTKTIRPDGKTPFLRRLSVNYKGKSLKIHWITASDNDEPHTHPWNFKSFLIIPYKEELHYKDGNGLIGSINHPIFKVVNRTMYQLHKTKLYKVFGFEIPALTIGLYGEKKQLCSFCQSIGYCKQNPPKDKVGTDLTETINNFDPFNEYERVV